MLNFTAPFDRRRTKPELFYRDNSKEYVWMMQSSRRWFGYKSEDQFQAVRLDCGANADGGSFHVTVVLPRHGVTVAQLLGSLSQSASWLWEGMRLHEGAVSMPRIGNATAHVGGSTAGSFKEVLGDLHLKTAFLQGEADFGALCKHRANGSEVKVFLRDVFHSTHLVLSEEGIHAATASAAMMASPSPRHQQQPLREDPPWQPPPRGAHYVPCSEKEQPFRMVVNRPFLLVVSYHADVAHPNAPNSAVDLALYFGVVQ
eukprot:TRINITY_DN7439_c0_g2_i3.p1 TRINITY_DN7439_c0_g2~~TRINITY_DN7439_c0_g2_i3.p1  ORF type:complete len:258 (-),score=58.86 TRINITY_DN7439_c0_g2_i3:52-825(-)